MNKEIEIPEGYEAKIENNKVIFVPKDSEDEKIRKALLRCCDDWEKGQFGCMAKEDVPAIRAYLEKQKEQKPDIELIQCSWYMEGYHDCKYNREPMWIVKTGEGGPRYELNPRYEQPLTEEKKPVKRPLNII